MTTFLTNVFCFYLIGFLIGLGILGLFDGMDDIFDVEHASRDQPPFYVKHAFLLGLGWPYALGYMVAYKVFIDCTSTYSTYTEHQRGLFQPVSYPSFMRSPLEDLSEKPVHQLADDDLYPVELDEDVYNTDEEITVVEDRGVETVSRMKKD